MNMWDVTFFVADNFSHSRDSVEMQFLIEEHGAEIRGRRGTFFYNANAQAPEDRMVQCLYCLESTCFDRDIEPVLRRTIPVQFQGIRVVHNDLETYGDLGWVVSTLELR